MSKRQIRGTQKTRKMPCRKQSWPHFHLKDFDGRSSFSTWLTRIAINCVLMTLRKSRRRQETSNHDNDESMSDGLPMAAVDRNLNPEEFVLQHERQAKLRRAIPSFFDHRSEKLLSCTNCGSVRYEIDETAKTLRLWVRRKRGNRKLICSGCGRKFTDAHDYYEREVRDLPWGEYRTTVIIEGYRVCCPQCGVRVEKVPQLPSKAPFGKRFEEAVGLACASASVRQVARQSDWLRAPCEQSTCDI